MFDEHACPSRQAKDAAHIQLHVPSLFSAWCAISKPVSWCSGHFDATCLWKLLCSFLSGSGNNSSGQYLHYHFVDPVNMKLKSWHCCLLTTLAFRNENIPLPNLRCSFWGTPFGCRQRLIHIAKSNLITFDFVATFQKHFSHSQAHCIPHVQMSRDNACTVASSCFRADMRLEFCLLPSNRCLCCRAACLGCLIAILYT